MKIFFIAVGAFILSFSVANAQQKFDIFSKNFVGGYNALHMPDLELSYVSGLQHIGSAKSIQKQVDFFNSVKSQLPSYKNEELTPSQKIDYDLISYETGLNLQRLALEQQWIKNRPAKISAGGIITVPDGKVWYVYLLKRWVNDEVTPDRSIGSA